MNLIDYFSYVMMVLIHLGTLGLFLFIEKFPRNLSMIIIITISLFLIRFAMLFQKTI